MNDAVNGERPEQRAGRLGIGIISAGRVGSVLALALAGAGHAITGVSAISDESRERAESMLPGVPILEVPEVVRRSELVLFAVPGSELPGLIAGLTKLEAWQPGQILLHTVAEFGYGVFSPALPAGIIPLALHPAIVFTGTSLDLSRLAGSSMAVTAPTPVLPIGEALAVEMGAEPVVIAEEARSEYAEIIQTARAFSGAVVRQSADALREIGITRPDHILGGLVRAAIEEELRAAAGLADDSASESGGDPSCEEHE